MNIFLANPRGFCAGVDRAIAIVERALARYGSPIYVRHEVVHNKFVVDSLRESGAIFIESLDQVPEDAIVIFSAHGVSKMVRRTAEERQYMVLDATCPLVTKVHTEVIRYRKQGLECILIGHQGHPEVEGTMGQCDDGIYLVEKIEDIAQLQIANPDKLAFVTQTTLSVDDTREIADELRREFPKIQSPRKDDICFATQNRQDAVQALARKCDLILVVGSNNSSNSNRLCEIPQRLGIPAYLINGPDDMHQEWLNDVTDVGVTAGASAPEKLVQSVVKRLMKWGGGKVTELPGERETVVFPVPKLLEQESPRGRLIV